MSETERDAVRQQPVWEARDVTKAFPGVRALDGVSLRLMTGEVHALIGENGSGKSTLAKCFAGTHLPDQGQIRFRGQVVELRSPVVARGLGVAVFYQELSLVPQLSVAENVYLGRPPGPAGGRLVSWRAARHGARQALARLEVDIDPNRIVSELSVAEQQLVEIARALSTGDITLLILDEPTAALGPVEAERLHQVVRVLARDAAVLYISHRLEEVLSVADVVTVLRDGRFVAERPARDVSVREVATMMIGATLEEHFAHTATPAPEAPLLEARNLRTANGVGGVSLAVRGGEVLGLGGLIGAGRTEIARALFGLDRLTAGEILIDGRRIDMRSPAAAIAAGIAFLPENRKADGLFFNLGTAANITIANLRAISVGPLLNLAREERRAQVVMKDLRISGGVRGVRLLSGGNQQKLVLGRWLFTEAQFLILDEPTQGIDIRAKHEIYTLIEDLTKQGAGVLLISSDYPELLAISDRVAVVRGGRIVHTAPRGSLSQPELLELASARGSEVAA